MNTWKRTCESYKNFRVEMMRNGRSFVKPKEFSAFPNDHKLRGRARAIITLERLRKVISVVYGRIVKGIFK